MWKMLRIQPINRLSCWKGGGEVWALAAQTKQTPTSGELKLNGDARPSVTLPPRRVMNTFPHNGADDVCSHTRHRGKWGFNHSETSVSERHRCFRSFFQNSFTNVEVLNDLQQVWGEEDVFILQRQTWNNPLIWWWNSERLHESVSALVEEEEMKTGTENEEQDVFLWVFIHSFGRSVVTWFYSSCRKTEREKSKCFINWAELVFPLFSSFQAESDFIRVVVNSQASLLLLYFS